MFRVDPSVIWRQPVTGRRGRSRGHEIHKPLCDSAERATGVKRLSGASSFSTHEKKALRQTKTYDEYRGRDLPMSPKLTHPRLKILIVDDDPDNSNILKHLFARSGWEPTVVGDATATVATLRRVRADVVLLDMMMPVMDGLDVLAALRADADAELARTPVLIYSAVSDDRTRARALAAGADDYIVKTTPFDQVKDRARRCAA
jgi:CheY-like chemotaxis protein